MKTTPKIGKVTSINLVDDTTEMMVISQFGKIIRIDTKSHPRRRPQHQGVKLLDLDTDDKVAAAVVIPPEEAKTHFGTPTPRAGSGTEEEFDSAYKRFSANPASLRVLFYFKTGVDDAFKIDLEQLAKVKEFKKKLGDAGVLYHDFRNDDALAKAISHHLENLLEKQWTGRAWLVSSEIEQRATSETDSSLFDGEAVIDQAPSALENLEEEPEVLDILVLGAEAAEKILQLLQGMTKKQAEFTKSVQSLNGTALIGDVTPQKLKGAVDELANILGIYSRDLATDLPLFMALTDQVISSLIAIVDATRVGGDLQSRATSGLPEGLGSLSDGIRTARFGMMSLRSQINSTPKYTGRLKKAQRVATEVFDQYVAYMTVALGRLEGLQIELTSRQKSHPSPGDLDNIQP
jgi:hypothetical protein